jgi:hypothetical protein
MRTIWLRVSDERGTAVVLALFIMAFLMVAGAFLLRMSAAETDIAYNAVWSESAFYAADAGLSVGVDGLGPNWDTIGPVATTPLGGGYTYEATRAFVETIDQPGYSIGTGTGYNPSGYVFYSFQVTATGKGTGLGGKSSAQRQVDARAIYGPVPR